MSKPKTINAYVLRTEYVQVSGDEIMINLRCRRKAARGSAMALGDEVTLSLTLPAYQVNAFAEAGAQGLRKLLENAEADVRGKQGWLDRLKRIAGAA